ncbi:LOW QUALITY PROTEIN: hypothetical protein V2J09_015786 [Rumex salicifolius]
MIDQHNPHSKAFRIARDRIQNDDSSELKLHLISKRNIDGYNLATSSEVAAFIVGDIGEDISFRDIGKDGYRPDIALSERVNNSSRKRVMLKEFCQFRIHERPGEASTLTSSRKLFLVFFPDIYSMVGKERIKFLHTHQKNIRVDLYNYLTSAARKGKIAPASSRKRLVLPSSLTGGLRYMM